MAVPPSPAPEGGAALSDQAPTVADPTELVERILDERSVRTVFQPIVDLDAGTVVAFEALSRGPEGPLQRPDLLFAAARTADRLADLDALCRETAFATALEVGVVDPLTLFVNIEPEVVDAASLAALVPVADRLAGRLRVVLEVTERAISARPAQLLATVRRLRAAGWRIALDDVGANDMSLTFMPLLQPDIVKLDLRLVQQRPGPDVVQIMHAVNGYAERTGALVLAEGIEHEQHLSVARALGARLGQGWMFGRPNRSLEVALPTASLALPSSTPAAEHPSPFDCLPSGTPLRRSTKPLLIEFSKFLEREGARLGRTAMVLSAFQHADFFTPATAHRYRELAKNAGFVAAVGEDLSSEPVTGVRGAHLTEDDPVRGEWDVIVLAPHFAAALLARDLGDDTTDSRRRFEFALTYDRDVVTAAAQTLLSRVHHHQGITGTGALRTPVGLDGLDGVAAAALATAAAEEATEVTFRRALAASTNGISIADVTRPDAPLIYINTAFERLSGMRAEQILGRNCRVLQGPDTDRDATARIREAVRQGREIRETILNYRGADREPWWNEIYLSPVFDADGRLTQYIGVQNDVTAQVLARQELDRERARSSAYLAELETAAFRDPLTGLLNRRRLQDLLETAILEANLNETALVLLYIDVDRFKSVNDRHGHRVGDRLLQTIADRLRARLRSHDLLARLGGDEFLIALTDLDRPTAAATGARMAAELTEVLNAPLAVEAPQDPGPGCAPTSFGGAGSPGGASSEGVLSGTDASGAGSLEAAASGAGSSEAVNATGDRSHFSATVSVGISLYPADGDDFEALIHRADQRMYQHKRRLGAANG